MRNADAHSGANSHFRSAARLPGFRRHDHAEPEWPTRKEIETIEAMVDPERSGEPPRATRKIAKLHALPMPLHQRDAFQRFQRANQNASANSRGLARNIQHEVHAIIEIDVHMAVPEKK